MKIKRYTATSMRAALALVRAEQGPDAVILSSRRGDDGIEVIAAVDYDEALFADAKRQPSAPVIAAPDTVSAPAARVSQPMQASSASAPAAAATRPAATARPAVNPARTVTPSPAPAAPARPAPRSDTAEYGAMQRELVGLRRMLEAGLAGMTWNDRRLREP